MIPLSERMPADSVRGRIRKFLETHHQLLGDNVLEVGSRIHDKSAWYINNRDLCVDKWLGIDYQAGDGVDAVHDVHSLPAEWTGKFTGVLCSEVLEHLHSPWVALPEMKRVLQPGGHILITTLTTFHPHGYPNDYYRYTDSGLGWLLQNAGFKDIHIEYGGDQVLTIKNHEEVTFNKRSPMQIFAHARA